MGVIEYDVKKLEGVISAYDSFKKNFDIINNGIDDSIKMIFNNWSGDTENFIMAKNDLESIKSNLIKIKANTETISNLIEEVTSKFESIKF